MKNNYIAFVLEEYISDDIFDADFGDQWIDEEQLRALHSQICDYAFANYGIDAKARYAAEVENIFEELKNVGGIVKKGDDYSDYWYRLRPTYKKKLLDEMREKNPITRNVKQLGEEVLRRALVKIAAEDGLRSMEEKWEEAHNNWVPSDEEDRNDASQETNALSPNPRFFESETHKERFVSLTNQALEQVEDSDLSNSEKSQAQGYLTAAKALSETPDPPIDLIWTILTRANNIAGIASFFVALITLIAMVA